MKTTQLTLLAAACGTATLTAFEGGYDYADLLNNGGTFYNDSNGELIQKAKVYGRAQWQAASTDGDAGSDNYVELRRLRLGAEIDFLNYFELKGNMNFDNGGVDAIEVGDYKGLDDVGLSFDLGKAFDLSYFDALKVTVGKKKIKIGDDVHSSSTKIITVERSAVTGKLRPDNSTGILFSAEKDGVDYDLGVFSNARDNEFNWWEDGADTFLYASTSFAALNGQVTLDATFNLEDIDDASTVSRSHGTQWGTSAAYATTHGETDVVYNLFLGDGGSSDGLFYGASILASQEIRENLELVGRAYYWASEGDNGVKLNSRYAASSKNGNDNAISTRTGDAHLSLYTGLNYYFIGHNSKVMTGVEWETLDTTVGSQDATTLWAAYRMYF